MSIKKGIQQFFGYDRFCTPGHKGKLFSRDVTEFDRFFPADYIEKAQKKTAQIFNAHEVRFLTNGSSIGIKAALMACNGDILAAQNSHQSIGEASQLAQKKLLTIKNEHKNGLNLPITPAQIDKALAQNESIGTVVLAHPDYYGINSLIESAQFVKERGLTLYVDAAHGAHYPFSKDLFDCRIFELADCYNLSAHKTLYSLTQTAYLCINNKSLVQKIDKNLELLGTTSPFYPFFESLEGAVEYNLRHIYKYETIFRQILRLKQCVICAHNDDFTRIVVDASSYNLCGKQLFERLKQSRIIAEKYDDRYVVFIVTLADSARKIKRLHRVLVRLLEEQCNK